MAKEKVIEAQERPVPKHTDQYFQFIQERKKKGRRKKGEPKIFVIANVPWDSLNDSELRALCTIDLKGGSKKEMELWRVLHPGVGRDVVIGLILGTEDPTVLESNKVHQAREQLAMFIYENWQYIWSQIDCNTCCWECPDGKALECHLENKRQFPGDHL